MCTLRYKIFYLFWSIKSAIIYKAGHMFPFKKSNMARDLRCLLGIISFNFSSLPLSILSSVLLCRIYWYVYKIVLFLILNLTLCIPSLSCLEHGFWTQESLLDVFSLFTAPFWQTSMRKNGGWMSLSKFRLEGFLWPPVP